MGIKIIKIEESVFAENDKIAQENYKLLEKKGIISFNFMGSPGSGKTTIIEEMIKKLKDKYKIGVIEGDIAGCLDSQRVEKLGIPVVQINTGGACHLDANMVKKGIEKLPLENLNIIFIENVGNLVCPAEFKLGNKINIVVTSTTEGSDKPVKYPLMFNISEICLLNKIDIEDNYFEKDTFLKNLKKVNPHIVVFEISARRGDNFEKWINFFENKLLNN
ncbi:MAG TPA: hydrogenase nickel incorporation protein HypB [bacterium]|nr:hydrogenase nickel incorporation protein HypB [bacterium]